MQRVVVEKTAVAIADLMRAMRAAGDLDALERLERLQRRLNDGGAGGSCEVQLVCLPEGPQGAVARRDA